jgi:hypothetical protein
MPTHQEILEAKVDSLLTRYQTTEISYYPYATGSVDIYKQRTKSFGSAIILVGRAILRPTPEQISVIGNDERYDIAFLFSRTEMLRKLSSYNEGEWMDVTGEMEWFSRRYKIEKVKPTGQVQTRFLLVVVLATTIQGQRD